MKNAATLPETNSLLLDFCNIPQFNHQNILKLLKRYFVTQTAEHPNERYDSFCLSKSDPHNRLYYLIDNDVAEKRQAEAPNFVVRPFDENFGDLLTALKASQTEYRSFLDECLNGNLNLKFINNIMDEFKAIGLEFIASGKKKWITDIRYRANYLNSIEVHINWEILHYFFSHDPSIFIKLKKCHNCSSYFLHGRSDKKNCSPRCKPAFYRKEHPDYHKNYVKNGRSKGLYQ